MACWKVDINLNGFCKETINRIKKHYETDKDLYIFANDDENSIVFEKSYWGLTDPEDIPKMEAIEWIEKKIITFDELSKNTEIQIYIYPAEIDCEHVMDGDNFDDFIDEVVNGLEKNSSMKM